MDYIISYVFVLYDAFSLYTPHCRTHFILSKLKRTRACCDSLLIRWKNQGGRRTYTGWRYKPQPDINDNIRIYIYRVKILYKVERPAKNMQNMNEVPS